MKLLLVNDSYFSNSFEELGIEVFRIGPGPENDLQVETGNHNLADLIRKSGFKPDSILVVDSIDSRLFYSGIEEIDVPTAFYAVDSPINEFWQKHYSHGFDRVYVDQYDQWRSWQNQGQNWVRWLPLAADNAFFHPPVAENNREFPLVFVGTVNSELRPKRSAILYRLRQVTDVRLVDGSGVRSESARRVSDHYRSGKLILNELLFDGINLRTFEAMAAGGVVLTERGRGENRLFEDGVHLVTYNHEDLEHVVDQLLNSPDKIEEISRNAADVIRKSHLLVHRAAKIVTDLQRVSVRQEKKSEFSRTEIHWGLWQASWKWPECLNGLKHETENYLINMNGTLDPLRRAMVQMETGAQDEACDVLEQALKNDPENPHYKAVLASISLARGQSGKAADTIGMNQPVVNDDLHLAVGDLLQTAGSELTPGFNRSNSSIAGWNAFEHYHHVFSNNENNREALKRLSVILEKHKASEFIAPLWQRYHANNPNDSESMQQLRRSAILGYYIPAEKKRSLISAAGRSGTNENRGGIVQSRFHN